jgi:hypothetical protein
MVWRIDFRISKSAKNVLLREAPAHTSSMASTADVAQTPLSAASLLLASQPGVECQIINKGYVSLHATVHGEWSVLRAVVTIVQDDIQNASCDRLLDPLLLT